MLAAVLYWCHALKSDRGNSTVLTATLIAHMTIPGALDRALKEASGAWNVRTKAPAAVR
jgi:hypothetical protein